MTAPDNNNDTSVSTPPAFTMFGKMLTFTRIKLETANLDAIESHLNSILTTKDSQIPVIIESDIEQDLSALVDLFWHWGLQPIGVVTGVLDNLAKSLKLAIFPAEGKRIERLRPKLALQTNNNGDNTTVLEPIISQDKAVVENKGAIEIALQGNDNVTSMIYDQMLRSGQSINHVGGDLILTNSVNHGAEVITDNSLHIYGRAQGRLVAGATGDQDARIFCQRFNPSLVSVAGTYCTNNDIPADVIDKAVQVSFKEGHGLVFDIMGKV